MSKKKKAIIIILIIAILAASGFLVYQKKAKEAEKEKYVKQVSGAAALMYLDIFAVDRVCEKIIDVWHNSVFKTEDSATDKYTRKNDGQGAFYDDFNDAISNLYKDESFLKDKNSVSSGRDLVATMMKSAANPPSEYKGAYDALCNLYSAYLDLTNLALTPQGTLISYTNSYNTTASSFMTYYKLVEMYG